jgi:hypothetical protein
LFIPGFRIRITWMWIRIQFFTFLLMLIHIKLFTSIRYGSGSCYTLKWWKSSTTGLQLKPPRLHFSRPRPSTAPLWALKAPKFWLLRRSGSSFSLSRWSGSETLVYMKHASTTKYQVHMCYVCA